MAPAPTPSWSDPGSPAAASFCSLAPATSTLLVTSIIRVLREGEGQKAVRYVYSGRAPPQLY